MTTEKKQDGREYEIVVRNMASPYDIDTAYTLRLPAGRRGRDYVVIEHPWEGDVYVRSYHASLSAAEHEATRITRRFERRNPRGYGYLWEAGRIYDETPRRSGGPLGFGILGD